MHALQMEDRGTIGDVTIGAVSQNREPVGFTPWTRGGGHDSTTIVQANTNTSDAVQLQFSIRSDTRQSGPQPSQADLTLQLKRLYLNDQIIQTVYRHNGDRKSVV